MIAKAKAARDAGEDNSGPLPPSLTQLDGVAQLTPLQRKRLREGKPMTSRPLTEVELKLEDARCQELGSRMMHPKKNSNPKGLQTPRELETIQQRAAARQQEHERRKVQIQQLEKDAEDAGGGPAAYKQYMQETKKGSRAATATKCKKAAVKDPADYAAEELEEYLKQLFRVADTNGDGVLQPHEMTRLLKMSGFGFTDEVIAQVIALTDANHDGVIQYEEFVPAMIAVMLCVDEMEEAGAAPAAPPTRSTGGTLPGGWPARSTPRDLWAANDPRLRYGLSHLEDFHNEAQHSSMRSRLTSKCRPTRYAGVTCLK